MNPELFSIRLDSVTDTSSFVEVIYSGPADLIGIELMGVDAGLSWLKGKSLLLEKTVESTEARFAAVLKITNSCEFRARGYDSEEDHWEDGMGNHRILRLDDGSIQVETKLDNSLYLFKGSLPIDFSPDPEIAISRVENIQLDSSFFQTLVDLSVWVDSLMEAPLSEDKIYPISSIMVFLKESTRKYDSHKVDGVIRPVLKSLFAIQVSALDFAEDDERLLSGQWERDGHIATLKNLVNTVRELEVDPDLGKGKDSFDRFRELLKFVS
ncbi:MAG: hypothetical protein ACXAE3_15230 [Candidatus Kariarchaeaceae archaeon]|jgi:hypothetical protein